MTDKQVAVIIANYARQLGMLIDPLLETSIMIKDKLTELGDPTLKVELEAVLLRFESQLNKISVAMQTDATMLSNGDTGYNYNYDKRTD